MMAAALLMALVTAGVTLALRDTPEEAVASEPTREDPEPTLRFGEPQRVPPEEPEPTVKAATIEPEPEPAPEPRQEPEPRKKPDPPALARADWPEPTKEQIEAASRPRRYSLTSGAVMGLTVKAIGIYNAPVFDSWESWALDSGVAHHPQTSMPWSDTPQRNVYLAGHRLGYPGTGSYLIFYNLDKLKSGDEVLLRRRDGQSYRYRVTESFVVSPTDSWVMGQVRGRDLVTLQTCTGPNWSQRLIVRAERV